MPGDNADKLSAERFLECYRTMLLIRLFEEALADLFSKNLIGGTSHFSIGQDACAVGVISAARDTDYLVSNHRGHGHLLARGLDPVRVMAELLGRKAGYCMGRGGSQHMCAMDHHFLGTNGITGGGIPIATGAAYALKHKGSDRIAVAFFGDGATNQGSFHESLNLASLWRLPVLYVCENNLYGMSLHVSKSAACASLAARAAAYSIRSEACDGMDLVEIRRSSAELMAFVRAGNGPAFLELATYRFCGHSKNDARVYRDRAEEEGWQERDCLKLAASGLLRAGCTKADVEAVNAEVRTAVAGIVSEALDAAYGDAQDALGGVYA